LSWPQIIILQSLTILEGGGRLKVVSLLFVGENYENDGRPLM
jgi:hypothetical protein